MGGLAYIRHDGRENLDALDLARRETGDEQNLDNYLLGVLAAMTDPETWSEALATARRCYPPVKRS